MLAATETLLSAHLAGRNPATVRAYSQDLESFRAFLAAPSINVAIDRLLVDGHGAANALVLAYRAYLVETGSSPGTVNRRLSSLRSLTRTARLVGHVGWVLDVESVVAEKYRDTRGPGIDGVRKLLESARQRPGPAGRRDLAFLRLLFDCALRCNEVCTLQLEHLDRDGRRLSIKGKARGNREWMALPDPTLDALDAWLAVRGEEPGALFVSVARGQKIRKPMRPLHADLARRMVAWHGRKAGVRALPHGLRHAAITRALDLTDGDIRRVRRFSRHSSVQTVLVYDDNRTDLGGAVARRVAASVEPTANEGLLDLQLAIDRAAARMGREATIEALRRWIGRTTEA